MNESMILFPMIYYNLYKNTLDRLLILLYCVSQILVMLIALNNLDLAGRDHSSSTQTTIFPSTPGSTLSSSEI